MDQMLQNRIQNLIGEEMPMPQQYALGGGVEPEIPPEMLAQLMAAEGGQEMPQEMPQEMMSGDQNAELGMAIDELSGLQASAEDPVEREMYERLGDAANAPLAEQAQMLAAEGRGDDTVLAHLRPGEVVLPPEMFDDAQFEEAVENRFNELDIDPDQVPSYNDDEIDTLQFATGAIIFNTTRAIHQAFDGNSLRDLYSHQTYSTGVGITSAVGSVTVSTP